MEKKYYWLKLDRNFFKRHDIQIIESMPNGKDYILFYLKLLVESIDHEGSLRFNDTIPYNDEMLSTITRTNIDIVRSAISIFKKLELMDILDDQTIYLTETTKMLGESSSTHRVQKFRENKKLALLGNVTETLHETEIEKDKEKDKEIDKDKESITSNTKENFSLTIFINNLFKDFSNGNENLLKALNDYKTMRTNIKKKISTQRTAELIVSKLKSLSDDPKMQIAILEQSIFYSWQGLFELKNDFIKQYKSSKPDIEIDWLDSYYKSI